MHISHTRHSLISVSRLRPTYHRLIRIAHLISYQDFAVELIIINYLVLKINVLHSKCDLGTSFHDKVNWI